jgi:succinate dehydrogenase / fumarate reductase cytochrome b subunit
MASIDRPLSPHLSIYRWRVTMALSILHRATGVALGVGTLFLAWWLIALAAGPDAFDRADWFMTSILGRLILLGFTWALFHHLCGGLRHLFWDAGKGFDLSTANSSSWLVIGGGVVLTLVTWIAAYALRA